MKINITYIYNNYGVTTLDFWFKKETKEKIYFYQDAMTVYSIDELKERIKIKYYFEDENIKMHFTKLTCNGYVKLTQKELRQIISKKGL